MKKFFSICMLVLVVTFFIPVSQAQTITTLQEKVADYQLPYPGILPDNPLYFIKQVRDSFMLFMAQGELKKDEVRLQISDKNLAAGVDLAKKGRNKLSVEMVTEAETRFMSLVQKTEKQKPIDPAFLSTLKKANLKHRETIENLMKDMPQGQVELMQKQREVNMEIGKKLDSIKG